MERLTRISFETSKLAQELGYSWKTDVNYYWYQDKLTREGFIPCYDIKNAILAPEIYLLADWIRETYNLHIFSMYSQSFEKPKGFWDYKIQEIGGNVIVDSGYYTTYQEAIDNGLARAMYIIKDKLNKDIK